MSKLIAAINVTLDGFCDHTAITADEALHQHYEDLLKAAGTMLYGRITYQLMTFWQTLAQHPSGEKSMDDFALVMDDIPKIVFSHTLKKPNWKSAKLANQDLEEVVLALKKQSGKPILVGSRSLIIQLMRLHLIDEFQLCIHPVIAGSGLSLFESLNQQIILKLINTKTLSGGAVILYYELV